MNVEEIYNLFDNLTAISSIIFILLVYLRYKPSNLLEFKDLLIKCITIIIISTPAIMFLVYMFINYY